ncbi:MAG TPA: hypothetical protein VFA96_08275, partial [Nocardioides sp.]|nr:hypothetical protein [Nocardioides sp.]
AAEGEPSQLKNRTYSRPWFGKPVSVAVTARTIALVDRGSPVSARSLASQTSDAIVADQKVLGLKHMTPPVLVDATTSGSVYNWAHHEVGALFVPSGSAWPGADNNSYVIKANPTYVIQLLRDRETLRHEITHLLLAYIGPSLPTWVSEGIAEYVGAYPGELTYPEANAGRAVLLAQPRALPKSDEWGDSPTYDYSVAHMSVLWLIERSGMRKFTQFLDEYQQVYTDQADTKTPDLLKQYFGVSVNQVVTGAFREFTRVPQP